MGLFSKPKREGEYLRKARQNATRHFYNAKSYSSNKRKYKAEAKKRRGGWLGFF